MSAIDSDSLKSASDPLIPFITRIENFTTAPIRHDTLLEFGLLVKSIKITNNDNLATMTIKTMSPSNNSITIDPSTELTLEEWTSFLEVVPNAVTGTGQIEMNLTSSKEARK